MTKLSKELLLRAFEAAPVGLEIFVRRDPDDFGSITPILVNQAACDASGQNLRDDVNRPWRESNPDLVDSEFATKFQRCLDTGEEQSWEIEYGDSRFARNWFRGTARRIDADTMIIKFERVTEQKRTELELERSNHELDDFAYVASHDLKAPLRDVDNLSSWLLEDLAGTLPEKSAAHLQTLRGRVQRMEKLLDDLLAYSRAGRLLPDAETFELTEILARVIDMLAVPEGFSIELPQTALPLHTPRAPLEVVLRNLIGNAIKHHDRDDGTIEVRARTDGNAAVVSVIDDGPGIAPEYHERVFQMFQSLRPRDEIGGTGLGLALARKHVRSFGGDLVLHSKPGEGSTFSLTWPLRWPAR